MRTRLLQLIGVFAVDKADLHRLEGIGLQLFRAGVVSSYFSDIGPGQLGERFQHVLGGVLWIRDRTHPFIGKVFGPRVNRLDSIARRVAAESLQGTTHRRSNFKPTELLMGSPAGQMKRKEGTPVLRRGHTRHGAEKLRVK